MERLDVIALGGNAILPAGRSGTIGEQFAITVTAMEEIASLLRAGRRVVITHGNGPIVGNILIRNEAVRDAIPPMPLDVCGADSQGGIGYMIQQSLKNVLAGDPETDVVSIVTQVRVERNDPAFDDPVKPIGPYYSAAEAAELEHNRSWKMVEADGKGYRRVVASPYPVEILESRTIKRLVEAGTIVIAVGGGGIPVIDDNGRYRGAEAVIDKDLASSLLARELGAERLIILTDVDAVYQDFGTELAQRLGEVSLEKIKHLYRDGQFPVGSMGSKIRAAIEFLEGGGRTVVVAQPGDLDGASKGERGTTIVRNKPDGD